MAYVFKNPGSRFWYAGFDFMGEDGKTQRLQRTTRQSSRKHALALAVAWEEAARKGTEGRLTISAARSVMSEITEKFTGMKLETITVRDLLNGWLVNKRVGLAKRSLTRYELVVRDFLRALGARAEIPVERLQEADVVAFRDAEARASKGAQTINLNVKIIRSALESACKRGLISHNPAAGVDRIEGTSIQREPFTLAEVQQLLVAVPDVEWKGMIHLGLYTGGRIGDLAHLLWRDVDLERGTISFIPEKTRKSGKTVAVPLHPSLAAFLRGLECPGDALAPIFPKLARKKVSGEHGLSRVFARIMAVAGVDAMEVETGFRAKTGTAAKGKARKLSRRSFHSLRHTAVSLMANNGVSEELRRKVTLHASADVHARYTHHDTASLRGAIESIPSL